MMKPKVGGGGGVKGRIHIQRRQKKAKRNVTRNPSQKVWQRLSVSVADILSPNCLKSPSL